MAKAVRASLKASVRALNKQVQDHFDGVGDDPTSSYGSGSKASGYPNNNGPDDPMPTAAKYAKPKGK